MKKLLSIILLCFCFFASAQEIAPNFIVTDIYGETHELYEYLSQDKYVVVNFMGTWSGPDQEIAQDFGLGFIEFGCNNFDVIFISIDTGSDTQACLYFEEVYMPGVQGLPMISGYDGGGDSAHQAYGITAVPTIVTISPVDTTYTETHFGFYGVLNSAGISQIEPWNGCNIENIEGCTDESASNFDKYANTDDGSCNYYVSNDGNCYNNDDLGLYFISDIHFRSYLSGLHLMCNDSLITNSIYHKPGGYEIDINQDYDIFSLDGLQFIDVIELDIDNQENLQFVPSLSNFSNLQVLSITNANELEISGLSSLINLQNLVLTDLVSFDASSISNLTSLTELVIGGMSIDLLPDLSALVNLEILNFHSLPNVNLLPDLSHLSNLTDLHLSELYSLETLPYIPSQTDVSIEIYSTPNLSCVYEEITSIQVPYYIYNLPLCEGTGCSNPDFLEYYSHEETYFAQSNGSMFSTYQLNGPLIITVNEDDGSCENEIIFGCGDSSSNNFNSEVNVHQPDSCIYIGCTDNNASNFNSWANVDDESCEYIYGCLDPTASNYNPWTTNIGVDSLCIYIEEMDTELNNLQNLVDSLNSQIQSFIETFTPPVVEEEVVSDANSFDVLNPLSYNGEFEAVHYNLNQGNYVVPIGKSFIINSYVPNNFDDESGNALFVNNLKAYNFSDDGIKIGIVCSEGDIISSSFNNGVFGSIHGILISKSVKSVHHDFVSGDYLVPNGKSLFINNYESNGVSNSKPLFINNEIAFIDHAEQISMSIACSEGDIISSPTNWDGQDGSMHGILIDNSNFTYATDYELIEALNNGMDSLSTMSEMVVLENDSISSQNAILSQENEALMAIDYNFDSLQYVADFLSSQVFELQQELLVPNIDVDMAIGWNMVGFSCPQQKNVEGAILSIVDKIIIFKDNSGNVYMPEFSFNGIGDLTPGHGYQLKVTDYILDFNICE